VPPSLYEQTTKALPGLATAGNLATNSILSQLQGDISPQAQKNMQDLYARFAVGSGMPGTNAIPGTLANNAALLGNYRTTEQLQQQGLQNYANVLGAVGQQQIHPETLAEIAAHNATLGAAPNPQAAAEQQLANYFASLNAARSMGLRGQGGGGGGYNPAGGTGAYQQQQFSPQDYGFGFGQYGQQGGQQIDTRFAPPSINASTLGAGQLMSPQYPSPIGPQPYYDPYGPTGSASGGYFDPNASSSDYWNMSNNDWGLSQPDYSGADWTDYLNFG
jgi:hypothetical protein